MEANKFRKILHKNCPKIVVILVYTILEWILILLLLLNSLFSYLIQKFAKYFGLKPFCMFCSRLDHILENQKHKISHLDHICEAHMSEISKLSYCSNHQRLSEFHNMCYNCSSTHGLFPWSTRGVAENHEEDRCCCCNEILSRKFFKPRNALDYIQEKASFAEVIDAGQDSDTTAQSKSLSEAGRIKHEMDRLEEENNDPVWNLGCNEENESVYITDMLLQNAEDIDSDRFICIELIDTEPLLANGLEDVEEEEEGEDENDVQDKDVEKCKKSGSNVGLSNRSMEKDSAEAEEVEGLDTSPDKRVEEEKCFLEKMGSRIKDSFDGSVINDKEESMTIEDLKSTIKSQQRALNALYLELEEERKAAAIAADETMAMITKLQEEKALVKIEALQYQRMMEEQAEYDQEALELLNNIVIKREKEKQELENELKVYQDKILSYETKEKMEIVRSNDDSLDSDQEHDLADDFEDLDIGDISLAEFDEARVLILEELKALEAKVFAIHEDEAKICKDVIDSDVFRHEEIDETELDRSNFLIQEEFSHVYERLQALEADKEFLKHCISSVMKGKKGLSLLQEILQHLRDFRSVENSK